MPILKQASSHTKKRTRIDREMISAPLGDFRHTMHVGRGGDVFGDTSFLSSHGPSSAPPVEIQAPNKNGLTKITTGLKDHEETKMADSLSQLSQSSGIGSGAGSVSSSPVNNVPSKDDSLWNNSSSGGQPDQLDWLSPDNDCGLKHAESMLSFHLDLGPSIMDDVLGIMDRDSSSPEWNTPNDLCGFDYKFSPVRVKEDEKRVVAREPEEICYSQPNTLPVVNSSMDYTSSMASEKMQETQSGSDGDSEEEKRSVYEGVADSPQEHERSLHIRHHAEDQEDEDDDDDEEAGQEYEFDDDLDDEIGV